VQGNLIVIRGGGDLGSGVALRLWRVGFRIVVLETPRPVAVRRTVALSEAVYDGEARVEEMRGKLAESPAQALSLVDRDLVGVLVDTGAGYLPDLNPVGLVDAVMAKRNVGTTREMAPTVVALGPGFTAGADADAVVETNRGPHLGRVYWSGRAEPNTGEPGLVGGRTRSRVLRAPCEGVLRGLRQIGDIVQEGEPVAEVSGSPVCAGFTGLLRGLARDGLQVHTGMKVGDIDPRTDPSLTMLVSDKALAIAGGVLEAMLVALRHNGA
jgi:xanthine dehydrogenase accessory factor